MIAPDEGAEAAEPAAVLRERGEAIQVASALRPGVIEIVFPGGRRVIVDKEVSAARSGAGHWGSGASMVPLPSGVRIWLAVGHADIRRGDELAGGCNSGRP